MPHNSQRPLFTGESHPVSPPGTAGDPAARLALPAGQLRRAWPPDLTHRLRVLLSTAPLHEIRQGDARRDPSLRHYDALVLALKIFDLIVDGMGLDHEVDRAGVEAGLAPLLAAMDRAAGVEPDPGRHSTMVDRVLGALRNEGSRREPFAMEYKDLDGGGAVVDRRREFRLVLDHHHPSGRPVLRLSAEAVNLFLNALELDIEDAQAATEALVHSQLTRGRLDEAVQSARNARMQSIRFQEKIERVLRDTRRDLQRVDWWEAVPELLDDALLHIRLRLQTERSIQGTAEKRRDDLDQQLAGERAGEEQLAEKAARLAEILHLVKDCTLRHGRLHEQIIKARNVFLAEQARQSFRPRPAARHPKLVAEVLEPLLALPRARAEEVTAVAFPALVGAQPGALIALDQLVAWLLRPRREPPPVDVPVREPELAEGPLDLARFDEASRAMVAELLEGIDGPISLGKLLDRLDDASSGSAASELLVLTALRAFAPDGAGDAGLRVDRLGGTLRWGPFWGDDLQLRPAQGQGVSAAREGTA